MRKSIIRIAAICFSLAVFGAGCGSSAKESRDKGLEAYNAGEYEKAAVLFGQAITQKRDRAEYYIERGMTYLELAQIEPAQSDFEKAIELNPKTVFGYRGLGLVYLEKSSWEKAEEAFTAALGNISDDADAAADLYICRAQARTQLRDYTGALEDYRESMEASGQKESVYLAMGNLYLKKKELTSALLQYQESINLDYRNFPNYRSMIMALKNAGYSEAAENVLTAALSLTPQNGEEYYYRGILLLEEDRVKEAFAEFEQAYNNGYEEAGICLGYCYELWEQYEEAELIYRKLLVSKPMDARIYNQMALCCIKQNSFDEALMLIEEGMLLNDLDVTSDLMWNKVICYEKKKAFDDAVYALEDYLKINPTDETATVELKYLKSR